jgi:hypothetical protein
MMRGRRWIATAGMLLAIAVVAHAQEATFTFPPGGMGEALKARIGKPVVLQLTSGTQIGGTLAEVRELTIVVKNITGRENSDAMIRLDLVAAVEVRAREH